MSYGGNQLGLEETQTVPSRMDSQRTEGGTLGDGLLAASTADAGTVDNVALLGLVTEAASLVGTRGTRGAVDDIQLSELY